MARFQFRRSLRFESLEARQLMSSGGPTDQEQYMLQLLNEARTNPAAAAAQITATSNLNANVQATLKFYNVNLQQVEQTIANATPQPPLAWNQDLANAAQGQSQYEADTQTQTHTGSGGSTTQQRIEAAGYTNPTSSGENTYAFATSVLESMQAFLIDWGVPSDGHRINIQQPGVSAQNAYTSVGIGDVQTSASNPSFGPLVITQDFGSQANTQAQVVGVAYSDNAGTGFYLPGEGQGGVQIDAVNLQTGAVSSTQTWDSGGYELALAPGQYNLIASLNNTVIQSANITVNNVNIEQDFILTNPQQGGTLQAAIAAAQPAVAPPVATPVTAQASAMGALNLASLTSSTPSQPSVALPVATPVTPQVSVMGTLNTASLTSSTPSQPSVALPVASPETSQASAMGALNMASLTTSTPSQPSTATPSASSSIFSLFMNSWSAWNAQSAS
jgi:uncharacterized protein YkwD